MPAQSFQAQGSSSGAGAGPAASHPADAQMHEDDGAHSDSSSFDEEDDQDYGDWVDDEEEQAENRQSGAAGSSGRFLALFPEESSASISSDSGLAGFKRFTSAEEALADAKKKGCDFVSLAGRLALDPLQIIRLLNHLRRYPGRLSAQSLAQIKGDEKFLNDDEELAPVKGAENDGLLQIDFDELVEQQQSTGSANAGPSADGASRRRIADLEAELKAVQMAYADLQSRSLQHFGLSSTSREDASKSAIAGSEMKKERDDDTHYFESYANNDIHQTMISDTSRTYSYAQFILSPRNAHLFRGKRVMDIGCGSGILSLFAARAGAREVLAIDASDIAHKAEANVRENKMDHIVKVIKGKVENLQEELKLHEGKIDVIISEWMGYFLLYESMLPSVLFAKERYLRKEVTPENPHPGLLAPSHCRMLFAAFSDPELLQERIHFWDNIHGFKMSAMTKGLYDEAYTEGLKKDVIISDASTIYDLPLCILPPKQPTFRSPFNLLCHKAGEVHGFVSWFDTWFMTSPEPYNKDASGQPAQMEGGDELEDLPECTVRELKLDDVPGLKLQGNEITPEPSAEEGAKGEVLSFTTSPCGKETHWKQTVFLLKEPMHAQANSRISGEIVVTQSETNSRELEVELHYMIEHPGEGRRTSEAGQPKKVAARMLQLFKVR